MHRFLALAFVHHPDHVLVNRNVVVRVHCPISHRNHRRHLVRSVLLEKDLAILRLEDLVRTLRHPEVSLDHELGVAEPLAGLVKPTMAELLQLWRDLVQLLNHALSDQKQRVSPVTNVEDHLGGLVYHVDSHLVVQAREAVEVFESAEYAESANL